MGMLHIQRREVTLAELVAAAQAVAVVRPAEPPSIIEEVVLGAAPSAERPSAPQVRYRRVIQRLAVEAWLLAPPGLEPPTLVEVPSPGHAASEREAHDAAHGLAGHVHHLVEEPVLVGVPERWLAVSADGPRLAFLAPTGFASDDRWVEVLAGLTLSVEARDAVVAALGPRLGAARPRPRRVLTVGRAGFTAIVLAAATGAVAVVIGLARC